MSTTTATTDSLPLSEGLGKPATGSPKPAAKQPQPTAKKETIATKSQPVNAAWAEEIVSEIGIAGPLAKKVATDLAAKISTDFSNRYTRQKLVKLVRASLDNALE